MGYGEEENENLGEVVRISSDGNEVALSSPGKNVVRVFDLVLYGEDPNWVQLEPDFTQKNAGDRYGNSLSLTSSNSLFVGAPGGIDVDNLHGKIFLYSV